MRVAKEISSFLRVYTKESKFLSLRADEELRFPLRTSDEKLIDDMIDTVRYNKAIRA